MQSNLRFAIAFLEVHTNTTVTFADVSVPLSSLHHFGKVLPVRKKATPLTGSPGRGKDASFNEGWIFGRH